MDSNTNSKIEECEKTNSLRKYHLSYDDKKQKLMVDDPYNY